MAFSEFLKRIARAHIEVNGAIQIGDNSIVNGAILTEKFFGFYKTDIHAYREWFFRRLYQKQERTEAISAEIDQAYRLRHISLREYAILQRELIYTSTRLHFMEDVFDIEYAKYDPSFFYKEKHIDYATYYRILFGIASLPPLLKTEEEYLSSSVCSVIAQTSFSSDVLDQLISYSLSICSWLEFKFHKGVNNYFSGEDGKIHITRQDIYTLQSIIVIFFHEATHYFRYKNGLKNFWFSYAFSNYTSLEEGVALYNEYYYGNQICHYWEFVPYYDLCLHRMMDKKTSEEEKKSHVARILAHKHFDTEKSLGYYYRFYRFAPIGSQRVYLKEAIYSVWMQNVEQLLFEDPDNYDIIMSGQIWILEIQNNLSVVDHNEDFRGYFEKMVIYIKSLL